MVSPNRWQDAQSYEHGFWDQIDAEMQAGDGRKINYYTVRAGNIRKWLDELGRSDLTDGSASIIEIGSGPIGVVGFLEATNRVAVDPLEEFYASRSGFLQMRVPSVSYRAGAGEDLPAESDSFDLAIIDNCIDHCVDMDAVMQEIRRVLRPGGTLYLAVNARSRPGYYVHRVLSRLKLDPGHPHTLTYGRVQSLVQRHGFEIDDLWRGSWKKEWKKDLRGGTKSRAKAVLGVSEFVVRVIARMR